MTPKKAIIIILILFLVLVVIFSVFYINKIVNSQLKNQLTNLSELSAKQQKIKEIEARTSQKVEQIVEQNQTPSGGVTPEGQRQIEEAMNQEIIEKTPLLTPEEQAANEKIKEDVKKLEDELNAQIREKLESKK